MKIEKIKTVIQCVKEIMKLPVDKKTSTVKMKDIKKLIDKLIKPLPQTEAWAVLNKMNRLQKPNKALRKELKKSISL